MHWHEELTFRIARKSGPLRVMSTLLDANRAITQDLPAGYLKRPHWLKAGQALIKAAESGVPADIAVATELLVQAVEHEGWMHKKVVTGADRLLANTRSTAARVHRRPDSARAQADAQAYRRRERQSGPERSR